MKTPIQSLGIVFSSSLLLTCMLGFCAVVHAADSEHRPNVIVILTDDQGAIDAGCYGASDIATPAIDSLAAGGVRFTRFYSAAPVCSPSRAGLLTGRYPLRAGLTGNASSQPGGEAGLPAAQTTMAEMFHAAGYATAQIGKWHLGYRPEMLPMAQGFDFSFGHMGGCIDNFSHFYNWQGPTRHDLYLNGEEIHRPGRFFADLMIEQASDFITRHRSQPFFLYFALNMPHYPYQGDVKWLEHYKHLPYPRNLYAAFLSTCDERIGALLRKVGDLGLRERTIILFQSDNGHSTEARAHFGGGSAGPYRGEKFSLFEGGIRLPAIISWPGHIPAGAVRRQVVHACDWMPTLAELSGVRLLEPDIDGLSIRRILDSDAAPSPHAVLHWLVNSGDSQPQWAVREGDWKLIGNVQAFPPGDLTAGDRRLFLANLATDPGEAHNVAARHPGIVRHLQLLHDDWVRSAGPAPASPVKDLSGNEQ